MRIGVILLVVFIVTYAACQQDPTLNEDRDKLRIDSFSPDSGRVGDFITIYGKGFAEVTSDNETKIGIVNAAPISSTDTTLKVKIMPNTVTGKVSVIVDGKVAVSTNDFKILKDTISAWQTIRPNIGVVHDIYFLNAAKGFCATEEGLYKSLDSGKTWSAIYSDKYPNSFFTVYFFSNLYGYAMGSYVYAYTTDGGNTWKRSTHKLQGRFMSFVSPAIGFLSAFDGIYKTTDTGKVWQRIYATTAHGVYFTDEQNGWITNTGQILKTTDGGKTFTQKFLMQNTVFGEIKFTDDRVGWSHTLGTLLLKTVDGGENWTTITTPAIYSLSVLNNNLVYEGGRVYIHESRDGGNTWKEHHRVSGSQIIEVFFLDEKTGWASDEGGSIYRFSIK